MQNEINLAVVGHTNVGKTSLLRALTYDSKLGIVENRAGTTRHVEKITFSLEDKHKIHFYDTPGLEDSIALFDYIQLLNKNEKRDGIDKLNAFLNSPEADHRFEQEAKVIRQLLKSDAAIYVVDVREPILEKYHDELALLSYSNKPTLAVFNYTHSKDEKNPNNSTNEEQWKALCSRVGIHAVVRFDAMFPTIEGESRLYQSLSLLLESAKEILLNWQNRIEKQKLERNKAANRLIADVLIDVTAYSCTAKSDLDEVTTLMQDSVRQREKKAINDLLSLYQFSITQEQDEMPLINGRFESDLFNKEAIKLMGIHLGKGMISGALIGSGIDLAFGGVTLGSAALIGATLGGFAQTARHYGDKIKNKFQGFSRMTIDDSIICFLSLRLQHLKIQLNARSHANSAPIISNKLDENQWRKGELPKSLSVARVYPEWSSLNNNKSDLSNLQRQEVLINVAKELG